MEKQPTLSVLVSARKNSKYLAKFLHGYFVNTDSWADGVEILIIYNAEDTWNRELVRFYSEFLPSDITFVKEDYKLGRAGLHTYFNDLYERCSGDWIVYFCEDHFINNNGWDNYVRDTVTGHNLDSAKPYVIVPKFDNVGAMNHIVSRGFCEALEGVVGRHGWIDSYINGLIEQMPAEHVIRLDYETFHDFTHDDPSPMSDSHMQGVVSEEGKKLPEFESEEVSALILKDIEKLKEAIG